jgi:sec-independent protein translocase protein TatA
MKLGPWEIMAILAVVLIVFGVGKLPDAMGQLGKGIRNFKQAASGKDTDDEKSESKKGKDTAKDSDSNSVSGTKQG